MKPKPTNGIDRASDAAFAPDPFLGDLTRLRNRLARTASQEGILDVAYRYLDSPVGKLLIAATPAGVVRVAFDIEDHDAVLRHLNETISTRILEFPARLDNVASQLDGYFSGLRSSIDIPVDFQLVTGFRRTVLSHLTDVAYGTTASYASLAALSGKPTAIRAAASACSHNPVPLVLPCHRIVKSDGSIGRYLGGDERKHLLLKLEQRP
jgi:methylated-DNA-[protein]-cysteine S-methyltransferase